MTQQIIILRGLPGSGKTTWAENWKKDAPSKRFIICKDDIGMQVAQVKTKCETPRNKSFRKKVIAEQERQIKEALKAGKDLCIADTNLFNEALKRVRIWAQETGIEHEIVINDDFLRVPLQEVLDRNEKRGCDMVPQDVIFDMYYRSDVDFSKIFHIQQNTNNPACVVFDMDGTLAEKGDRGIYEWDKVGVDTPNFPVVELAKMYVNNGYNIVVVSARQATTECVVATEQWLENNHIPYADLFMRADGDMRRDWIVKEELLKQVIKDHYIHLWVDDRQQVVNHIRTLGINVLQCKYGRY